MQGPPLCQAAPPPLLCSSTAYSLTEGSDSSGLLALGNGIMERRPTHSSQGSQGEPDTGSWSSLYFLPAKSLPISQVQSYLDVGDLRLGDHTRGQWSSTGHALRWGRDTKQDREALPVSRELKVLGRACVQTVGRQGSRKWRPDRPPPLHA